MEDRGNKTIMCSVFFLDIVEYSKKSVAGQISLKERFNSYLSNAIRDVPVADRIILDTGDGAAINFLGDVEDALKAALSLRESLLEEDDDSDNPLLVRMGINLGPVRLVRDINGQPNIVGDGINVAQRVMGFADPGQVLVSRSYYDAVSRLSHQYAEMFHYQGSRTDKHVREHEVYAIGYPGELTSKIAPVAAGEKTAGLNVLLIRARKAWDAAASRLDDIVALLLARIERMEPGQRLVYAGAGIALLLVVGVAAMLAGSDGADEVQDGSLPVEPVSAVVATVTSESAAAEDKAVPEGPATKTDAPQKAAEKKPAETRKSVAQPKPAAQPRVAAPSRTEASSGLGGLFDTANKGPDGFVSVGCKEGALVFVDGTQKGKIGASEQMVIGVPPGKHTVIVTHSGGGMANQSVDVTSGKTVRIRPGFCGQ
jgi:hypothetical protein